MKTDKNLNYYQDKYMDLFLPEKDEFFTIINFHGGGLVEGDKGDTHLFCEHLAMQGFAVGTANYSLLSEAKFPAMLYDAAKAVKYIFDNISKYGKSKGLIIMGQSAGAWITLMLCLNKEYLNSVGLTPNDIYAFISDAAQTTNHFNILKVERNLNPLTQRIDEAAPLYYVDENTMFSRLLLLAYVDDLPNRVEQNQFLMSTIKSFNNSADVTFRLMSGSHCSGSSVLQDNEYPTIVVLKEWLNSRQ